MWVRGAVALASYVGVVPRLRQIGQARVHRRAGPSARKCALPSSPSDADISRRPNKSLVAHALRAPVGCRQAIEGRASGLHAQTAGIDTALLATGAPLSLALHFALTTG